jgi:putative ubiquitin-RnfH superfamily antitoxin RatB of RatAB toxin-antitoxin module
VTKYCQVVCDTRQGIRECRLELPAGATIAEALQAARLVLGEACDWDSAATGIYGRQYARDHVPSDGDRIELYRTLQLDPRSSRRVRAAKTAAARTRR